jgi:hypothetical protein
VFETRWTMSYLRGPLTRTQIKTLADPVKAQPVEPSEVAPISIPAPTQKDKPVLPPEIPQYYIPVRSSSDANARISYRPMLLGAAQIHYTDSNTIDLTLLAEISDGPITVDWNIAIPISVPIEDLQAEPEEKGALLARHARWSETCLDLKP